MGSGSAYTTRTCSQACRTLQGRGVPRKHACGRSPVERPQGPPQLYWVQAGQRAARLRQDVVDVQVLHFIPGALGAPLHVRAVRAPPGRAVMHQVGHQVVLADRACGLTNTSTMSALLTMAIPLTLNGLPCPYLATRPY